MQLAHKKGGALKVLYHLVACPSLMSNFAAFRTDKDVEKKDKARREYTQSEKNCGVETKLGELNLFKGMGSITDE